MSRYLLVGTAAAAMIGLAPAVAQTAQPAPQVFVQRIPAKAHTRAEVGTHVRAMFERLDTNRDGYVTKAEAQAARVNRGDRAERIINRMRQRGVVQGAGGAPNRGAMFDRLDTNRDGNISRSEFESAPPRQERRVVIHTNRDGAGAPGAMRGMRGMRMGGMGMGGLRGAMFDMADANRDGRVTLQEATAAAYRHFDMADVNRDGQITSDERMQMRQRMRTERRPG
jgi:hypothetical protein